MYTLLTQHLRHFLHFTNVFVHGSTQTQQERFLHKIQDSRGTQYGPVTIESALVKIEMNLVVKAPIVAAETQSTTPNQSTTALQIAAT